jgi:hypothetical protein
VTDTITTMPLDLPTTEVVPLRRNNGHDRNRDDSLKALAEKANAAHLAHCRAKGESIRFATECGEVLLVAKRIVGHGRWLAWVKANLTFKERTGRYYMKFAKLPEADRQRVAEMSLRKAIEALAQPQPKQPIARPTLSPDAAVVVNAFLAIEGDAVMAHITGLKEWPNTVVRDQVRKAFDGWLKQSDT